MQFKTVNEASPRLIWERKGKEFFHIKSLRNLLILHKYSLSSPPPLASFFVECACNFYVIDFPPLSSIQFSPSVAWLVIFDAKEGKLYCNTMVAQGNDVLSAACVTYDNRIWFGVQKRTNAEYLFQSFNKSGILFIYPYTHSQTQHAQHIHTPTQPLTHHTYTDFTIKTKFAQSHTPTTNIQYTYNTHTTPHTVFLSLNLSIINL